MIPYHLCLSIFLIDTFYPPFTSSAHHSYPLPNIHTLYPSFILSTHHSYLLPFIHTAYSSFIPSTHHSDCLHIIYTFYTSFKALRPSPQPNSRRLMGPLSRHSDCYSFPSLLSFPLWAVPFLKSFPRKSLLIFHDPEHKKEGVSRQIIHPFTRQGNSGDGLGELFADLHSQLCYLASASVAPCLSRAYSVLVNALVVLSTSSWHLLIFFDHLGFFSGKVYFASPHVLAQRDVMSFLSLPCGSENSTAESHTYSHGGL